MNKRKLTLAAAVMMLAALVPATAYHIDGNEVDTDTTSTPTAITTMTSADWEVGTDILIVCESNGNHSSRNPVDGGRHGLGGLCVTGENDATGVAKPNATNLANTGTYVELDTCDQRTFERNGFTYGPYGYNTTGTNETDAKDCGGDRSVFGFTAELGIYTCEVQADEAFFYDRLYAWWSYDGAPHYDSSDAQGDEENGGPPAMTPVPNNEDAFHGHVAVFINATDASAGSTGSVVTNLTGVTWSTATGAERCDSAIGSNGTPVFVADDS